MTDDYRVVFSTDQPLLCPSCNKKRTKCKCGSSSEPLPCADGGIRVRREVKGRGGKVVTVITGLPLTQGEMKELLLHFKQLAGCGGTIKHGCVELQGDRVSLACMNPPRGVKEKWFGG
jgi:translation initiation factor 1